MNRQKCIKHLRLLGFPLVYFGVTILTVCYVFRPSAYNAFLLLGLFFIIFGIIGQIMIWKKSDKY